MADQNLIAPQLSLGHGTQSSIAAPLSLPAVWLGLGLCLPSRSPPPAQSEMTHRGTSCFVPPALAPGAFTVGEATPETVPPFKCNLALQERERKRWLVL